MPYTDKDQARKYSRDRARALRAGAVNPSLTMLSASFRVQSASCVIEKISEQIAKVENDLDASPTQRASCIAKLLSVQLKAVQIQRTVERLEAIENVLSDREGN